MPNGKSLNLYCLGQKDLVIREKSILERYSTVSFYVQRTGCQWEMMPHDLPPYSTVYAYFRKWQRNGTWQKIHDQLRHKVRKQAGKEPEASAASLDSQSVKTTEKRGRSTATMVAKRSKAESDISS
jgi:putative transposase